MARNCYVRQKQFSLVFVYFYSQFAEEFLVSTVVNVQYNIDRDQKKLVSTVFVRNSEMKSSTVFWCFDRSVVTLHRRVSITPPTFARALFLISLSFYPSNAVEVRILRFRM